ncbi:hypothetical protein [Rubritalea tangerina]|uniref:hypothetical protein n=1 Tax=Rubritalea tangerina TaxID=430798 RepID=UPI0036083666
MLPLHHRPICLCGCAFRCGGRRVRANDYAQIRIDATKNCYDILLFLCFLWSGGWVWVSKFRVSD